MSMYSPRHSTLRFLFATILGQPKFNFCHFDFINDFLSITAAFILVPYFTKPFHNFCVSDFHSNP